MKQKRILAFLLSVAMTISLLPTFTLTASADETQVTTTEKNITLGTSALKGKQQSNVWFGNYQQSEYTPATAPESPTNHTVYTDSDGTKFVYLSKKSKYYKVEPVKWHVLDTDNDYNRDAVEGETDTTRGLFLLSDSKIEQLSYNETYAEVTWETSTIRSWLNGYSQKLNQENKDYSNDNFINAAFFDEEKNVIAETNVLNNEFNGKVYGGNDTNDKIFLLSRNEVQDSQYGFDTNKSRVATNTDYILGGGKAEHIYSNQGSIWYWLRSPGINTDVWANGEPVSSLKFALSISAYGSLENDEAVYKINHVRPAFNIDVNSVLFTTPAVSGKNTEMGVDKPTSYEGTDYKLTVLDSDRKFKVSDSDKRKGTTDKKITVGYSGAMVGSNEYISAILTAENSNDILYYGQITNVKSESGTITLTLPSELAEGKYTLKLFNEQINGDYKTDFSSAFSDIDLTIGLAGEGTETAPYLIHNLSDLEYFRDKVNAQEITSHSAILTADITIDNSVVWKPITLKDQCESTFDGKGHTITFANTKEGSTFGLFGSYNYSTISNLYLKGSITCNQSDLMGALVNSGYRTTVNNVISTVSITNSGNASTGGLFGRLGGKNTQAMIKNCAVYADISSAGRAGGLIGENWGGTQHCFVQNSAYMGDVSGSTAGAIMGYNGLQSNCYSCFTDVYYCEKDGLGYLGGTYGGTITATRVESKTAEQFRSGEVAYLLNNGVTDKTQVWYQTCKTDSYPKFKGDTVYRGYVCGNSEPIYANSMDGLIINPTSEHSYDEMGFCVNCKSPKPADFDNTENVYKIYSLGELKWFADKVNGGETAVNGKLMNDVDATTLSYLGIGKDASHAFAGTFDGNNKTLKIALVSTEQYVAPFLYVNGATIKNLTVSGTIETTHKFAAGIVGRIERGNANLENCLSLVEIDSTNYTGGDGTHGGLIAVSDGGTTTVNNCGFAGSIIGKTTTSCGGIVGWAGSTVKISNSFVAAKFELKNNSGDTFARNQSKVTVTNCYYLNALSDAMYSGATQATADKFASGEVAYHLQGTQETQIWGQKVGTDKYPTLSNAKVYEDEYNSIKVYRNEIDGNKIILLGADKKSVTVVLDKAGTYTIVFADYEDNRLANVKTFEVTVTKPQAVRVISDKDFTLGTSDKIMLWDNLENLTPMCEAYEVK